MGALPKCHAGLIVSRPARLRGSYVPTISSYHLALTGTPYENGKAKGHLVLNDKSLYANLTDRLKWFDCSGPQKLGREKLSNLMGPAHPTGWRT